MDKRKLIGTTLGIIMFILLIAGITYAYISWTSGSLNYTATSRCFVVYYTKGTNISGTIMPSSDYTGGLSTTFRMNVKSSCNLNAKGKIYLTTSEDTTSNLYREGLLNYTIVKDTTEVASGTITSAGEIEIDVGSLTKSTSASTSYKLYIWINYDLIENSDVNSAYSGSFLAGAVQYG